MKMNKEKAVVVAVIGIISRYLLPWLYENGDRLIQIGPLQLTIMEVAICAAIIALAWFGKEEEFISKLNVEKLGKEFLNDLIEEDFKSNEIFKIYSTSIHSKPVPFYECGPVVEYTKSKPMIHTKLQRSTVSRKLSEVYGISMNVSFVMGILIIVFGIGIWIIN